MAYQELDAYNASEGIQIFFLAAANNVPMLPVLLLAAVFMITLLGSYFSSRNLTGRNDFPASFAVAGIITSLIAFIMNIIDGFVPLYAIVISVVIAVIGVLWLMVDKTR